MEIKLADYLKIETDIPLQYVEKFNFSWKPGCHALLKLEGYLDRRIPWDAGPSYNSRIKIWLENERGTTIIYHGYTMEAEIREEGKTNHVFLEAMSASCLLDRNIGSRSFQDTAKTYGEAVREMVEADGGQLIRNRESDKEINAPVIRYEETTWQFAKRMGERLGICIIPDVETGKPNLWFGMRNGKEVPVLPDGQCHIQMRCIGKEIGSRFMVEGRSFYKIGDRMEYFGQNVTVMEVEGIFGHGELTFKYILEDHGVRQPNPTKEDHPAGLGFWGIIKKVKGESVTLALDIDNGQETGDYFYPWYPETGNALYAMPETGARALLYFCCAGEQEGAVIHCLNKNSGANQCYDNRAFSIEDGNVIDLSNEAICFSRGGDHELSLDDSLISTSTSGGLTITAKGKVRLKAKQIMINTPEELNLCQG
uniref:hypothetical protein n=1 Tax=Enterocloster clostridioformis TaxID=1531 RepID=UPI0025A57132|nr:hypothetical protein [Enterocloster clostridioformis]